MPVKWTPANTQMLLWLAWGHCKYEAQNVLDAWPSIPGEETPSKIAIQHRMADMKKGIRDYGVASFFSNDMATLKKSRKVTRVSKQQHSEQARADDVKFEPTATANGLKNTTNYGTSTSIVKDEVPDAAIKPEDALNASIKPEDFDSTINVYSGKGKRYLATPPKTRGRGGTSAAKESNNRRKRRRSDTDTDPDSASPTAETNRSDTMFFPTLGWERKLLGYSEGDTDDAGGSSGGSDATWVPGVEEGRRKRVRRD